MLGSAINYLYVQYLIMIKGDFFSMTIAMKTTSYELCKSVYPYSVILCCAAKWQEQVLMSKLFVKKKVLSDIYFKPHGILNQSAFNFTLSLFCLFI